ncbi:MAG: Gfo/Idh/MocA family oxidoreductase [Ignavibacteriaceae bacterium]|nr:Gfo/Idh/MocA family oxidoreductase [Ignavibacteriaceae bacterium]
MADRINFALIGCGYIGKRHAEHIARLGNLVAVCDIKENRAIQLSDIYKCKHYVDIDVLLDELKTIDVVSICTPNGLHASHSIKSLNKGYHVVCEKPMALNAADCKLMIKTSKDVDKTLFIIKQNRFNPPIVALKKVIEEGRLGRIMNVQLNCFWNRTDAYYLDSDWKGKKALDGGVLFTQFSHFIDLLYWLVGEVSKVYSFTRNYMHPSTIEFEDSGVVVLEFFNGAIGAINYSINSFKKNMEGSITIVGEKGTVKVGGQYLNVLEYQCIDNYVISDIPESRPANEYGFYQGSMSNHDKIYENVIYVLNHNGTIAATGEDGLKTVEIIEKIYSSIAGINERK